jgi:hypothetical protein
LGEGGDDVVQKAVRPYLVFFGLVQTLHRMHALKIIHQDEFSACEKIGQDLAGACRSLLQSSQSAGALSSLLGLSVADVLLC